MGCGGEGHLLEQFTGHNDRVLLGEVDEAGRWSSNDLLKILLEEVAS
jgi:hypothetical protein